MSAYQIVQQTRWPIEKQLSAVVSFALLQEHLACGFASYLRAFAADVPPAMATLMTAFRQTRTPLEFQLQVLSAYVDAYAPGVEIPAADFILSALGISQPEPAASAQPTFASTNPFLTAQVYGYGVPLPPPVPATPPTEPVHSGHTAMSPADSSPVR